MQAALLTADRAATCPTSAASRYFEGFLAAAALISAAIFVFSGMTRPVWLDEANSVLISSRSFSGIIAALGLENNLPGYYFLLALWMRLFGDSEIALRTLSGLFYLAGCGGAFALGRRLIGDRRAGWYSALFYECSAIAIRQAQNIRMYTMLGMLSAFSTLAFVRLFRDRDRSTGAWALFFTVNALGLLTHVWFVFVLFAQALAILTFERKQVVRFAAACAASALPFAVLWGPRFLAQFHNGATDWMNWFQVSFLIVTPLELYNPLAGMVLYTLAIGTLATAGARRCRELLPGNGVRMLLVIAIASLAVPLAVSALRPIYSPGRYTIIAVAPLAAVLGAVLSRLLPRPLLAITGVLLLAVQLYGHIERLGSAPDGQSRPGQSDRLTSGYLLSHAAPGDAIVFTSLTRAASDYYFRRAKAADRFVEISFPASAAAHLGRSDPKVLPARKPALESEALTLAARLRKLTDGGARVWTFDGYAPQQTAILREEALEAAGAGAVDTARRPVSHPPSDLARRSSSCRQVTISPGRIRDSRHSRYNGPRDVHERKTGEELPGGRPRRSVVRLRYGGHLRRHRAAHHRVFAHSREPRNHGRRGALGHHPRRHVRRHSRRPLRPARQSCASPAFSTWSRRSAALSRSDGPRCWWPASSAGSASARPRCSAPCTSPRSLRPGSAAGWSAFSSSISSSASCWRTSPTTSSEPWDSENRNGGGSSGSRRFPPRPSACCC